MRSYDSSSYPHGGTEHPRAAGNSQRTRIAPLPGGSGWCKKSLFSQGHEGVADGSGLAHTVYFQVYTVLFVLRRVDFHTEMQRVPEVSARDCDFSNQDRGWECGNDTLQVTMETAIALWCGAESSKNTIAVPWVNPWRLPHKLLSFSFYIKYKPDQMNEPVTRSHLKVVTLLNL